MKKATPKPQRPNWRIRPYATLKPSEQKRRVREHVALRESDVSAFVNATLNSIRVVEEYVLRENQI